VALLLRVKEKVPSETRTHKNRRTMCQIEKRRSMTRSRELRRGIAGQRRLGCTHGELLHIHHQQGDV
jgi:hypothetical protein